MLILNLLLRSFHLGCTELHAGRQLWRWRLLGLSILNLRLGCLLLPNRFCLVSTFRSHTFHDDWCQGLVRVATVLNHQWTLIGYRILLVDLDFIEGKTFIKKVTFLPNLDSTRFLGLDAWQFHRLYFSLVAQVMGLLERAKLFSSHFGWLATV